MKWLRDCGCEDFLPFAEFFIPSPVSEGDWTHNTAMPHAPDTCLSSKGPLVRLQGVKSDHLPLPEAERWPSFCSISSSSGGKQLGWVGVAM